LAEGISRVSVNNQFLKRETELTGNRKNSGADNYTL
jgi:hypothetical protein